MTVTKSRAVPGGAPSDKRTPEVLSSEDIEGFKAAADANAKERARIYRLLLMVGLSRLRAGRSLERAHGVVHPEVTAISRDVARFTELVFPGGASEAEETIAPAALTEAASTLANYLAQRGAAKVSKASGLEAATLRRLAAGHTPTTDQVEALTRLSIRREDWERTA